MLKKKTYLKLATESASNSKFAKSLMEGVSALLPNKIFPFRCIRSAGLFNAKTALYLKDSLITLRKTAGFSLIELLIAMVLSLSVLAAVSAVYITHHKSFGVQENVAEMIQNGRMGMDTLMKDLKMAGYNPTGVLESTDPADDNFYGIKVAQANQIQITMDVNDDSDSGSPDGDLQDLDESVTYALVNQGGIDTLAKKRSSSSDFTTVCEHVRALTFSYFDAAGGSIATPVSDPTQIRSIQISLTVQTAKPDPDYTLNNGYRISNLTTTVAPRNLSF